MPCCWQPDRTEPQKAPERARQTFIGNDVGNAIWSGELTLLQEALQRGDRDIEAELAREWNEVFKFKNRPVSCQVLHVAIWYPRLKSAPRDDVEMLDRSTQMTKLLLEARADCNAEAVTAIRSVDRTASEQIRRFKPIHLAAAVGSVAVLELLIEKKADIHEWTTVKIGSESSTSYRPIHEATFFNHRDVVQFLLKSAANPADTNDKGETGLHIAARGGYHEIVRLFLRGPELDMCCPTSGAYLKHRTPAKLHDLVVMVDQKGKTPLDVAVDSGRFPPEQLYLFTWHLTDEEKAFAFKVVATYCPAATGALLRKFAGDADGCDQLGKTQLSRSTTATTQGSAPGRSLGHPKVEGGLTWTHSCSIDFGAGGAREGKVIDKEWRRALQWGASEGHITVETLSDLVEHAPESAACLVEVLTDYPEVMDPEKHPLPIRARIREKTCTKSFMSSFMSCAYVGDLEWDWDPRQKENEGAYPWQLKLAPHDPVHGEEVRVRVLKLRGPMNLRLLHSLAHIRDNHIFGKLVIHALIKHAWHEMRWHFMSDVGHELLATLIITRWIVQEAWFSEEHGIFDRAQWSCVAAHGLIEVLYFALSLLCSIRLSLAQSWRVAWTSVPRLGLAVVTLLLAGSMLTDEEVSGRRSNILLAASSLLHWLHLLFELRAFRWTGQRLLPIVRAIRQLPGMLVILLFLLLAFVNAFWALDPRSVHDFETFRFVYTLFTGEEFLSDSGLQGLEGSTRSIILCLTIVAIFCFLACTLNVFIAVLGDCYDLEQERVMCTFSKERAKLCSGIWLKHVWSCRSSLWKGIPVECWTNVPIRACLFLVLVLVWCLLLLGVVNAVLRLWASASCLALILSFVRGVSMAAVTSRWDANYMWMCHGVKADELEQMAGHEEFDIVEVHGRIARIKRFVHENGKDVTKAHKKHSESILKAVYDAMSAIDVRQEEQMLLAQQQLHEMEKKQEEHLKRIAEQQNVLARAVEKAVSTVQDGLGHHDQRLQLMEGQYRSLEKTCGNIKSILFKLKERKKGEGSTRSTEMATSPDAAPGRPPSVGSLLPVPTALPRSSQQPPPGAAPR